MSTSRMTSMAEQALGPHFVAHRDADGALVVALRPELARWRAKKALFLGAITILGFGFVAWATPPYSLAHAAIAGIQLTMWGLIAARLALTRPRWTASGAGIGYERRTLLARRRFAYDGGQIAYGRTAMADLLMIRGRDGHRRAPWQSWLAGYYIVGDPQLDVHPVVHALADATGLPIEHLDGTSGCAVCAATAESRPAS